MPDNGAPQVPEEHQSIDATLEESQDPYTESIEIRLEFQQRLPGGFIRFSWRSVRRPDRARKVSDAKPYLRIIATLLVLFTLLAIGLIAVGPEGVWEEIKTLLPNLVNSITVVSVV